MFWAIITLTAIYTVGVYFKYKKSKKVILTKVDDEYIGMGSCHDCP